MSHFALVGKPNSGKSSLFNLLTGLHQKIANYGGATLESKVGEFHGHEITDLPGIKSLHSVSLDERITKEMVLEYADSKSPILFVLNGMQLENNMLLFSEIADLQIPTIVVINFKDDLAKNRVVFERDKLAQALGCPVVMMNSRNGDGLEELKQLLDTESFKIPNAFCKSLYDEFQDGEILNSYKDSLVQARNDGAHVHENDFFKRQKIIGSIVRSIIEDPTQKRNFLEKSKRWDRFFLHPIYGILFFLFTMLLVFQAVFYFATIPMDWIDQAFASMSEWTNINITNEWVASIISDGILPGLGGVLIFVPQIAILFFLLGILEHSGYLSRISFISNRFLSKFGLSGQSVIPLMSSWACAIPAIMSARMIDDPKERMAVIFATPLMTCSARLPVYTILIAVMVPNATGGIFNIQGVLLLVLYLIGVIATLVTAWFISRRAAIPSSNLWSLELPVYRIPNWRNVLYNMYLKTKAFVIDAGKIIFIVAMVLWFLASYSPQSEAYIENEYQSLVEANPDKVISKDAVHLEYSFAGYLGKLIEPAIKPLGYDWKMGIALISSFAAREVFVGSLSTIYSVGSEEESLILTRLRNEVNADTGEARYNLATCVSLLLFYVFALQCMSTMAIVRRETGSWRVPIIQFVVMLIMAYVFAFIGYRLF